MSYKLILPHEFIDSDDFNYVYIILIITIILTTYILQFFIELKDIIILSIILFLITKYTK